MLDAPSPIHVELDRVGASFRKAGVAGYISVQLGVDEVKLLGPPREHPRRTPGLALSGGRLSCSPGYRTTPEPKPPGGL